MVGISLGIGLPGHIRVAVAVMATLALALSVCLWRRRSALIMVLLFASALGYLSIQPWLTESLPDRHVSRFVNQGNWRIVGAVADSPQLRHGRLQFTLQAHRLTRGNQDQAVYGRVKVTARGGQLGVQCGDRVELIGHLRAIRNFANPGGFDYERFMALQGIRVRVYARGDTLKKIGLAVDFRWHRRLAAWRQRMSRQMETALARHPASTQAVLQALILGERSRISAELSASFKRAGVGHILAISGLHIGMVAYAGFLLAVWSLSWIPWMLEHAWSRKGAVLFSLGPVIIYGMLAGMSPSTQRAMLMVTVLLLSHWVGRSHDWLNSLAVAALVILLIFPPALLSVSFQLSFAAVLAIVIGMGRRPWKVVSDRQAAFGRRLVQRVAVLIWVSILAIAGTMPLVMRYFNQFCLVGIVSNLLVIPLVGFVVVPAGLAGVLASMVNPALGNWCWQLAAWGLDPLIWAVEKLARWPWAAIQTVTPSELEIVLFYGLVGLLFFWKHDRWRIILLALILALGGLDAGYWYYQRQGRRQLRVTAVDVGQGTANLLELPGGYTALVDGGGFSDNQIFDMGALVLAPLLWRRKINTVDLVVLSHPNSDHLNGLLYILAHFHVHEVWSNHEAASTLGYAQWRQVIRSRHIRHPALAELTGVIKRYGAEWRILSPPEDLAYTDGRMANRHLNADCLVLQVRMGKTALLFAGDITERAETGLLERVGIERLSSDILVVPHHGSRHSSSLRFLQAVHPAEAVISAGWQNRFGFPHAAVLERLDAVGARVWRTDRCGAVVFTTDGGTYDVQTMRINCE